MGQALRKRRGVSSQDLALFKIKCIRDLIKMNQRKLEIVIIEDDILTRKLLNSGQRDKAKSLVRKKLSLQKYLRNADGQLESLEELIYRLELSVLDQRVVEGLALGNETLKRINDIINIKSLDKILLENKQGLKKKAEIDEKIISLNVDENEIDLETEFQNILNENEDTIVETNNEEDKINPKKQIKDKMKEVAGPSGGSTKTAKNLSKIIKKRIKEVPLSMTSTKSNAT
ncbi:hypothetical protein O3M35_001169 [Rhynocoris fuscipes]|uniref:Charged multivesicular body protein 6 n=1 Tax=Rhynocoris fuscipes TaxID=488301 RepID=A0AAW1DRR1_9HEMI